MSLLRAIAKKQDPEYLHALIEVDESIAEEDKKRVKVRINGGKSGPEALEFVVEEPYNKDIEFMRMRVSRAMPMMRIPFLVGDLPCPFMFPGFPPSLEGDSNVELPEFMVTLLRNAQIIADDWTEVKELFAGKSRDFPFYVRAMIPRKAMRDALESFCRSSEEFNVIRDPEGNTHIFGDEGYVVIRRDVPTEIRVGERTVRRILKREGVMRWIQ